MLGSVCGMIEKGPMAMHGIVGQGLGFPSRCGVRGCQVALLEDQRGRAHVKDSSEAYCPAMELRVFFADLLHCTTPGYAVSTTRRDTDSGPVCRRGAHALTLKTV